MAERVRLIPMQARSASERNPRGITVTAARIPLLALRAWMAEALAGVDGERVRLIPMQARSASERNPRGIPVTAARIPLLALRAWMKAGLRRGLDGES